MTRAVERGRQRTEGVYPWADCIGHNRDVKICHFAECFGENQFEKSELSGKPSGLNDFVCILMIMRSVVFDF